MLRLGDTKIEVFQYENPVGKAQDPQRPVSDHGIIHLCLRVTDIQAEYTRLCATPACASTRRRSTSAARSASTAATPSATCFELLEKKQKKQ